MWPRRTGRIAPITSASAEPRWTGESCVLARWSISSRHIPSFTRALPGALVLPLFVSSIPEMIVPYADAAALMLANLTSSGEMSRHRVGLALPVGMRRKKKHWAAKAKDAPGSLMRKV